LNLVEKKTGKGKGKELEETQTGNESVGPSAAGAGAVEIDSLAGRANLFMFDYFLCLFSGIN
jgi:hypothetical protein